MVLFNAEFFGKMDWKLMVLDEGHRLKNPKGKLYDVLSTRVVVKRKVILSGTPVQNDLVELYSLLSLLNPTLFNDQQLFEATFKEYFSAKAQQLDAKQKNKSAHLVAAEDLMRDILTPLLLLRTVQDVNSSFTLPPISEMVVHTPLSPMQRELYKEIVAKNSEAINSIVKHTSSRYACGYQTGLTAVSFVSHRIALSVCLSPLLLQSEPDEHPAATPQDLQPPVLVPGHGAGAVL